jgi:hypothetical protein
VTRDFARALVSVGHRLALATLALEAAVDAHHAALRTAAARTAALPVAAPAPQPAAPPAAITPAAQPASPAATITPAAQPASPAAAITPAAQPAGPAPSITAAATPATPPGPDPGQAQLDQFADLVRQASAQLAEALHRLGPPGPLPPLREVQATLPADGDWGALFAATDNLVDALNTAADILRRHLEVR